MLKTTVFLAILTALSCSVAARAESPGTERVTKAVTVKHAKVKVDKTKTASLPLVAETIVTNEQAAAVEVGEGANEDAVVPYADRQNCLGLVGQAGTDCALAIAMKVHNDTITEADRKAGSSLQNAIRYGHYSSLGIGRGRW